MQRAASLRLSLGLSLVGAILGAACGDSTEGGAGDPNDTKDSGTTPGKDAGGNKDATTPGDDSGPGPGDDASTPPDDGGPPAASGDVLTYHKDIARTGVAVVNPFEHEERP